MKRTLAILLAVVLLFACIPASAFAADIEDYEDELDELSAKYDELEAQQKVAFIF